MGHDPFAYIVQVRDHSVASFRQAFEDLRCNPPPSGPESHTGTGGYIISDKSSVRFLPRPVDLDDEGLQRIARAVIRNLNAPPQGVDFPENPWTRPDWDDLEAQSFFRAHADKWGPAVVMPLSRHRAFVFGKAGG
jgi:hypothetical protein